MYTRKQFDDACKAILYDKVYIGGVHARLGIPEWCTIVSEQCFLGNIKCNKEEFDNSSLVIKYAMRNLHNVGCHYLKHGEIENNE